MRAGGTTFTLMDTCFEKPIGLQGEQRNGCSVEFLQISVDVKQNPFLPHQRTPPMSTVFTASLSPSDLNACSLGTVWHKQLTLALLVVFPSLDTLSQKNI